jgi:hypothetical protein
MAYDGNDSGLLHDLDVLEAIGGHIEGLMQRALSSGAVQKTVRRWVVG